MFNVIVKSGPTPEKIRESLEATGKYTGMMNIQFGGIIEFVEVTVNRDAGNNRFEGVAKMKEGENPIAFRLQPGKASSF